MKHFIVLDERGFVAGSGMGEILPDGAIELEEPFQPPPAPQGAELVGLHWASQGYLPVTTEEDRWTVVRRKRDGELRRTDWTQIPDVPEVIQLRYRDYRQDLRDITDQPIDALVWPTLPPSN